MAAAVILLAVAIFAALARLSGPRARARVKVDGTTVRVIPEGLAKVAALRPAVTINAGRITEVHESFDDLPGRRFRVGRFRSSGVKAFLVVGTERPVVVIECPGDTFDRVVFSATDPATIVHDVTQVMASHLP